MLLTRRPALPPRGPRKSARKLPAWPRSWREKATTTVATLQAELVAAAAENSRLGDEVTHQRETVSAAREEAAEARGELFGYEQQAIAQAAQATGPRPGQGQGTIRSDSHHERQEGGMTGQRPLPPKLKVRGCEYDEYMTKTQAFQQHRPTRLSPIS